jgi:co-chaperonin GroES (HSP10)
MHNVTKEAIKVMGIKKLHPLYDRVIVIRDKMPEKSSGGIDLVETFEKPNWCTVVSVPHMVKVRGKRIKPSITAGDRVFIRPQDSKPLAPNECEKAIGNSKFSVKNDYEYTYYYCIEVKLSPDGEIVPLENKVVINVANEEKVSPGGIILVKATDMLTRWQDDTGEGEVVSSSSTEVAAGDKVLYTMGEGAWIDEQILSLDSELIYGVFDVSN